MCIELVELRVWFVLQGNITNVYPTTGADTVGDWTATVSPGKVLMEELALKDCVHLQSPFLKHIQHLPNLDSKQLP